MHYPKRKAIAHRISPDLLEITSQMASMLGISRSAFIEFAMMHFVDYLGTGRRRATLPALMAQRMARRGIELRRRASQRRRWSLAYKVVRRDIP